MGRPKLSNMHRDSTTGRSRGETEDQIKATVRMQRIRMGISPDDAFNALHGSSLGSLHRRWQLNRNDPGGISAEQYYSAEEYIRIISRNAIFRGIPPPHPRSPNIIAFSAGQSTAPDPDEDVVSGIKAKHKACRQALLDIGKVFGLGSRINKLVYEVCIEGRQIDHNSEDIGNLRIGLNALGKVLK